MSFPAPIQQPQPLHTYRLYITLATAYYEDGQKAGWLPIYAYICYINIISKKVLVIRKNAVNDFSSCCSPNKKVQVNQEPLKHWQRFHLCPRPYFKHPSEFTAPLKPQKNKKSSKVGEGKKEFTPVLLS